MSVKRPCNECGCPELVEGKESRCPAHKKKYNRDREQWRRDRDPNYRTLFDSKEWNTRRDAKLAMNPDCEWNDGRTICGQPAKFVQQVNPNAGIEENNLRSLCPSHHSGDTRRAWKNQAAP